MAVKKAPAVEEVQEVHDGDVFELNPEQLESIVKKARRTEPHKYQPNILESLEKGVALGIKATPETKDELKILSGLRTAAKQVGCKVRIWDRTESDGYVGFKAFNPEPETESDEVASGEDSK